MFVGVHSSDLSGAGMKRIALGLEYCGSSFCGWQSQPSACAIQDHLQSALTNIAGHQVVVTAAGRTDAGVHALAQVAHFDTAASRPLNAWVRGVNAFLPSSIRVQWASEVPESFHARFSAISRRYQYILQISPVAPAILHGRVGWYHRNLDVVLMQKASGFLLGEHDFSAFRAAECQAKSPVKTLTQASVLKREQTVLFEFSANAFLHHMIRNLVGSLIVVGKGEQPPEWMVELLQQKSRKHAAPTFMPDGLYFTGVEYDAEWGLPELQRSMFGNFG